MADKRTALKVFRVKQKMTQAQFAEKLGYSRTQYAMIEQGNRDGKQDFWNKLQTVFNIADSEMWSLMQVDK